MTRGALARLAVWVVLGTLLRVVALDGDGLWCDEGYTAWVAHLSPAENAEARRHDDAPALYYAIQRGIVPHLPPGEASVRALSVAAGVAGIVWMAAAPPVPGAREALTAFAALAPYGVYYGRQGRSYALLILFSMILLTATLRALKGDRRWLPVVALSEAAALWTHNVAAPLIVCANLAWLVPGRRRDPVGWWAAQAAALVLWLPSMVQSIPQLGVHAELNAWIGEVWRGTPLVAAPFLSLVCLASGARAFGLPSAPLWSYHGPGATALGLVCWAIVLALLVASFRGTEKKSAPIAALFALGPLVLLALLSMLTVPAYILGRTDAIAYAGTLVWAGVGFTHLPRIPRWTVAAVLLTSTALAVATHLPLGERGQGNDRRVGTALRAQLREGDWIAYCGLSRPSVDYYASSGRPGVPDPMHTRLQFPASFGANPAAVFPVPADSLRAWEREARGVRARLEEDAAADSARALSGRSLFLVAPIHPGRGGSAPAAGDLHYPASVLAYTLEGLRPLAVVLRLPGDQMNTDWILLRVRASELVPLEELQPIEAAP